MSKKKPASATTKGKRITAGRKRNPEGVSRAWGAAVAKSAEGNGSRKNGRETGRGRNPAESNGESEEILKANELLLHVWENAHAKRGVGKLR